MERERHKVMAYPWGEGGWAVECPAVGQVATGDSVTEALLKLREAISLTVGPCQLDLVMTIGKR